MFLKLIEANVAPKIGDLAKDWIYENLYVIKTEADLRLAKEDVVMLPYGISSSEIIDGDWYLIYLRGKWELHNSLPNGGFRPECIGKEVLKVNILPEQFNYQEIVDLELKNGDELPFKSYRRYAANDDPNSTCTILRPLFDNDKVMLSKPTPVTYTKEDMEKAFEAARVYKYGELYYIDFEEWFNLNKKKQ
jgi:hypothetical protein